MFEINDFEAHDVQERQLNNTLEKSDMGYESDGSIQLSCFTKTLPFRNKNIAPFT